MFMCRFAACLDPANICLPHSMARNDTTKHPPPLNGKLAEALKAEVLKTEDLNNRMLIQPWPDTIGALIIAYTKLGVLLYV